MAEPDVKREPNLQAAPYVILNKFFDSHQDETVELEVLPQALTPAEGSVLQDGRSLGVPKKVLVEAYLVARQVFLQNRSNLSIDSPAYEATNTILLFDPEHLTAVNFRKRRLMKVYDENFRDVVVFEREMLFVTSILTSPLHRQTKSPTLWHHRFWLLDFATEHKLQRYPCNERPTEYAQSVLNTIFQSGEQHPKNYYAWQYARRMIDRLRKSILDVPQRIQKLWFSEFLMACAQKVKTWCCQHPSDTSGWSFLLFLIPQLSILERTFIIKQVLGFTFNVHAQQESLWVFLRTVLAHEALNQVRDGFVDHLRTYMRGRHPPNAESDTSDIPASALAWIEKYKKDTP
jgi:hypothetical protein